MSGDAGGAFTPEWCERMARLEQEAGDPEIGAGLVARDPEVAGTLTLADVVDQMGVIHQAAHDEIRHWRARLLRDEVRRQGMRLPHDVSAALDELCGEPR